MSKITYADKVALNTNAGIPAQNKISDTDMNNVKKAINQLGSYVSATVATGQPGKCYITAPGTLASGDVFNVVLPSAVNPTANAQFSVDGGNNYFNIIRQSSGTNVLVKYVAGQYVELYFNGTAFIFKENVSKVLYNGSSKANITLNETVENFNYIEIFYFSGGGGYNNVKIYSPHGKQAYLITNAVNAGTSYFQNKLVNISGTSITNAVFNQTAVGTGTTNTTNDNNISITRVIGYR